jgi:hypothetical protein
MFSIGEQINRKKNKTNHKNKRKRKGPKYSNYIPKTTLFSNINNKEEKISLTEHTNILNEYQEELNFLGIKRKNSNNLLNIDNNEEIPNNNTNTNSKSNLISNDEPNKEDNSIKILDLYKLYHNLFIKSGIEGSRPSNFIYYLLNDINDSLLSNKSSSKINFGDIKKLILKLPSEEPENSLINILINEYFHSDFSGNSMEKIITKINNSLIDQDKNKIFLKNSNDIDNNNKIYYINDDDDKNDIDTIDKSSKTKKDKLKYANIFNEKMNKNNYLSCLSLTNDLEYFKSFLFVYNKYLKEPNLIDKNLENSLETNKQLLKSFNEENKEIANEVDKAYLNNILKNKKLRKYISKKLIHFQKCNKNKILNILDKYNFNYIGKLLIDNKIENLNKLKTFNNLNNHNFDKTDISNFLTLILIFIGITLINNSSNISPKNDLTLLFPFFNYFKQLDINIQKPQKFRKRISKGNKIKIKLDNTIIKEFNNDNSKNKEEKKVETEYSYHNKFPFNNNEFKLNKNEENKINNIIKPIKKNSSLLKVHNSNKETSIGNDRKINNINMNENEKNSNKLFLNYLKNENNKQSQNNKNMEKNNLNKFRNKLIKKLSFCHDIYKLNSSQNNENNIKNIYEKQEENFDNLMKIKEDNCINVNNNYKVKLLEKNGNKIIIYEDELSEENNNL